MGQHIFHNGLEILHFFIIRRGCNYEVYELKLSRHVVIKLARYFIQHNIMYQGRVLDMDKVNDFPENGLLPEVIVYDNGTTNDSSTS